MQKIISSWFPRVIRFQLNGALDAKMNEMVMQGLTKAAWYKPTGIIVTINSPGGVVSIAQHIADSIKHLAARNNAPMYCFAQDMCLGSANLILTSGVKCYASTSTILGGFGYNWHFLDMSKLADKYGIKQSDVAASPNQVQFKPFESLSPLTQKFMQNAVYNLDHAEKVALIDNRSTHFRRLNLTKQQIEGQLLNPMVVQPSKAIKYGLIDDILFADELIDKKFKRAKIVDAIKTHQNNNISSQLNQLRYG